MTIRTRRSSTNTGMSTTSIINTSTKGRRPSRIRTGIGMTGSATGMRTIRTFITATNTTSGRLATVEPGRLAKVMTAPQHRPPQAQGGRNLLSGNRRPAATQQVFLYFARRGLRQIVHERNPARRFEVGKIVTRELNDFGFCGGFAGTEHDKRMRRFSPFRVRHAYDRDLLHRVVAKQHALDLHRRDVFPAADDDVLESVADLDISVGMHHCRVAGMKPSVDDRFVRFGGVTEIAFHHDVPANADFPEGLPVAGHILTGRVQHPDFARADQLYALAGFDDRALGERKLSMLGKLLTDEDERRSLCQAIDMRDIPTQPALDEFNGDGGGRRPGGQQPHDLACGARAYGLRSVRDPDQHGRRGTEGGDRLAFDQFEDRRWVDLTKADMRRAARGDSPHEGPSVSVKHRQRPQIPIFRRYLKMRQRAEDVEVGVAVSDHHAFGACSCAAGVVDGDQIVLVDLDRHEGIQLRLYEALVIEPPVPGPLQGDESFDSG